MKLNNLLPVTALLLVTLMGSCTKESNPTGSTLSNTTSQVTSQAGVLVTKD